MSKSQAQLSRRAFFRMTARYGGAAALGAGAVEVVDRVIDKPMAKENIVHESAGHLVPAQVLDLRGWKIGLPTTAEVTNPGLETYRDDAFQVASYVQFTAHCGDRAQAGSKYARSELREMTASGAPASWSTTSGTHQLTVVQRITHLPKVKPELICGQIHNDNYLVLIELSGSKLYVRNVDDIAGVLDYDYQLGRAFTLGITAADGQVAVSYNGESKVSIKVDASGCYFKVGCYVQSNTATGDSAKAYGQVEVSRLLVTHID